MHRNPASSDLQESSPPSGVRSGPRSLRQLSSECAETEIAGRYTVLDRLGEGGMSVVYLAHDWLLDRAVAVKMLRPHLLENSAAVRRLCREARIMGGMKSRHAVVIHDSGEVDGAPYIVMEALRGETLEQLLAREGHLPPRRVVEIALAVCDVLAEAHRRQVVHRDIKPGNVFLLESPDGGPPLVKLLDFGVAGLLAEDATCLTAEGDLLGTAHYMSPEQAMTLPIDERSDLYSLGALMYRALAGTAPFEHGAAVDLMYAHVHETPEHITRRTRERRISSRLGRVVMRLLQKRPEARHASAEHLAAELAAVLEEAGAAGAAPERRRPARMATLLGLVTSPARRLASLITGNVAADTAPDGKTA